MRALVRVFLTRATNNHQVDLPEDPNLRELTSGKPAFVNTPKDGNSPRSEPSGRGSLTADGASEQGPHQLTHDGLSWSLLEVTNPCL